MATRNRDMPTKLQGRAKARVRPKLAGKRHQAQKRSPRQRLPEMVEWIARQILPREVQTLEKIVALHPEKFYQPFSG